MTSDLKHLRDMVLHIRDSEEIVRAGEAAFLDPSSAILFRAAKSVLVDLSSAADGLTDELKAGSPQVPWRAIHRTRSKLAHHYDDIQRTLVWETLVRDLPALRAELEDLIRTLDEPTAGTASPTEPS